MNEEFEPKGIKNDENVPVPVKQELINRLEQLPLRIKNKEMEVMNFSNNASLNETDVKEREILIMESIAMEREENPSIPDQTRKKYPNENARQGELRKRLIGDKAYRVVHKNWEHNKEQKQKSEIQLKYLINQFSACKWLVRLVTWSEENG